MEVSTIRGRRWVEGIDFGGVGRGGMGCVASCSQATQWGLWVRPANAVGARERLRGGGMGRRTGLQRAVESWAVYLCPADKYHRLTHRPSQEQKDLDERAIR